MAHTAICGPGDGALPCAPGEAPPRPPGESAEGALHSPPVAPAIWRRCGAPAWCAAPHIENCRAKSSWVLSNALLLVMLTALEAAGAPAGPLGTRPALIMGTPMPSAALRQPHDSVCMLDTPDQASDEGVASGCGGAAPRTKRGWQWSALLPPPLKSMRGGRASPRDSERPVRPSVDRQVEHAAAIRRARSQATRRKRGAPHCGSSESEQSAEPPRPPIRRRNQADSGAVPAARRHGAGGWASVVHEEDASHSMARPDKAADIPSSLHPASAPGHAGAHREEARAAADPECPPPRRAGARANVTVDAGVRALQALKKRRRHYSQGSMELHKAIVAASNAFDLLALLSSRIITLEMGDYREKWVDPSALHTQTHTRKHTHAHYAPHLLAAREDENGSMHTRARQHTHTLSLSLTHTHSHSHTHTGRSDAFP